MSGTSLDGVDGVLVCFDRGQPQILAHAAQEFPAALRREFLALNEMGPNELHRSALAANALTDLYAQVVQRLLQSCGLSTEQVTVVGVHGQTVRHQPQAHDGVGYTIQINNPALLAELIGIDVVADFRTRDVAAGGQGAPLVPAFHQDVFGHPSQVVAVLNIGGISNLTVLRPNVSPVGFDCGPGNVLLDSWCQRYTDHLYDHDGAWAATGRLISDLLMDMRTDAFFSLPPPKSTGRDHFHMHWLEQHLLGRAMAREADVQATLVELTACSCVADVRRYAADASELIICGGGALNGFLMQRLKELSHPIPIHTSADRGFPPLEVEACAFAWLAWRCVNRKTGNVPSVTGARGERVLGAIYPR